ncbi:MAG: hypothetical protein AB7E96_01635 [Deferribacterales bacterium]
MSYREVRQILNAVFDSDDNVLKTVYKTDGEVLNMVLDETGDPALKVRIEGYEGASAQTAAGIGENLLINSAGLINQRNYISGTATSSANQYTLDRWRIVTAGQSLVFATAGNITTFTAPSGGCEQVAEGLSIMTGIYTLSWEGTATAAVNGISVSNGGQVTLTGGTNAAVRFTGGTFKKPKLEYGGTATEWLLENYSIEKNKCERYARQLSSSQGFAFNINFTYDSFRYEFASMRVAPSLENSGTYSAVSGANGTVSLYASTTQNIILINGSGNWTPGSKITYSGGFLSAEL